MDGVPSSALPRIQYRHYVLHNTCVWRNTFANMERIVRSFTSSSKAAATRCFAVDDMMMRGCRVVVVGVRRYEISGHCSV